MVRRIVVSALLIFLAILLLLVTSLFLRRNLPDPNGPYAVGRSSLVWTDPSRPESLTSSQDDRRSVGVQIWYPAEPDTGTRAPYIPDLDRLAPALRESGELDGWQVAGLRIVRGNSFWHAAVAKGGPFPVLLLSPGGATNVEFYSALAEELASYGYIVIGINHPYDVPAVAVSETEIAGYYRAQWNLTPLEHQAYIQGRIDVRVDDALFVLERLAQENQSGTLLDGQLDLDRVGFLGHSLGGITAAQACQRDMRIKACLNLDGIQAGGPFSAYADPPLPGQPFMFITKEEQLHPKITEQFGNLPTRAYVVRVKGASHDQFTDGPLLTPSLLPLQNQADRTIKETRRYAVAFFDQELKGESSPLLANSEPDQSVEVVVYP